jgi:GntR family transcriptional regulator, transcriptional repressor for pyruvate dehydrogenase complex
MVLVSASDPDVTGLPGTDAASSVVRMLLEHLLDGDLVPGDRLPPERQLAATFDVGRSAVREALAALEILGIVEVRAGSGSYLRGTSSELLPQTLSWGLLLESHQTAELIELRTTLEVATTRMAALRIDDVGVERLAGHLDAMAGNLHDLAALVEADMRFHSELGRAARNAPTTDVLQSVRALLRVGVERAITEPDQADQTLHEHRLIYLGVAARNPDAAGAAMQVHMDSVARRILPPLSPPPSSPAG